MLVFAHWTALPVSQEARAADSHLGSHRAGPVIVLGDTTAWVNMALEPRARASPPAPSGPGWLDLCDRSAVLVEPVVTNAGEVVDAVAQSVGQPVSLVGELDVDVYRLARRDAEPDLVVRAFGPSVDDTTVSAAAHVLVALAGTPFPAERCAVDAPVLAFGGGRHLFVTEYVEPAPPPSSGFILAWCAGLLGRLATRPGTQLPRGGGWHRLGATASQELGAALRLGDRIGSAVAEVVSALSEADDGTGLPDALIHADLTPPNAIPRGDQPPVIVDWVGVGRGPRAWPLAYLLFVAGPRSAPRTLERYARSCPLSAEERHRLPEMMVARPLALDLWSVAHERMSAQQAVTRCRRHQARAAAVAAALDDPGGSPARSPRRPPSREQPRTPATARTSSTTGEFVTETLHYDGGRRVTAYVPPRPPEAVVFAGDGQLLSLWGPDLGDSDVPPTLIVGVHRPADETIRLHEYSPTLDPKTFAAHERFFVDDVRRWVTSRFGLALPPERTAVLGVSAGAELALALGLRHPDVYGTVLCASPGAGYRPPAVLPSPPPRAYLVAGTLEPFFRDNATQWVTALRAAGADVLMTERVGSHGDPFWRQEFPLMATWAFGPR